MLSVGARSADLMAAPRIAVRWAAPRFAVQAVRPRFAAPMAAPRLAAPMGERPTGRPAGLITVEPYIAGVPITEAPASRPEWRSGRLPAPLRRLRPTVIIRRPIIAPILRAITARLKREWGANPRARQFLPAAPRWFADGNSHGCRRGIARGAPRCRWCNRR